MGARATRAGEYLTIWVSRDTAAYLRAVGERTGRGASEVIRGAAELVTAFYQTRDPALAVPGKDKANDKLVAQMELQKLLMLVADRLER